MSRTLKFVGESFRCLAYQQQAVIIAPSRLIARRIWVRTITNEMTNIKHLSSTPHTSNVHDYLRHKRSNELQSNKLTNVLILGPLTAQWHCSTDINNKKDILAAKRVQSAPCLGAQSQAQDTDSAPTAELKPVNRSRHLNQVLIIGMALAIHYALMVILEKSYKGIARVVIPILIFAIENKLCYLLSFAWLPVANAEIPTEIDLQPEASEHWIQCMY